MGGHAVPKSRSGRRQGLSTNSESRPMHWRTDANLYPPEIQLTKASEPSFDLEGGAKGQI